MPDLVEYCEQLCRHFARLFELSEDQAGLYREIRQAVKDKAWSPLNQNMERMEFLAREQGRVSKQILGLRGQLQSQLPQPQEVQAPAASDGSELPKLLKISELLPLLPVEQRQQVREIWQQLRESLLCRQSELQALQHYSEQKQEMIEGFLAALKDDELDRAQSYGRVGSQRQSGVAAPSRIFSGEA